MPLRESDRHLTTFIIPFGRFRYKRAPQGFVSSGDGYNRRFDAILSDFQRKERCVDDTIHYDLDLEEHWWRTIDLLRTLGESGIVLNADKFQFCQKSVEFAGFRVGNSAIEPLPKYLDAIRDFPTPKNITDIRSWFGLVNQVANYAQLRGIMAPFRPFLSPKNKFEWSKELDEAFEASKEAIVRAIIKGVEIFDLTKKTCLRPDWSREGIGYFLLQKHCQCASDLPDCCSDGWRIVLAGSRFPILGRTALCTRGRWSLGCSVGTRTIQVFHTGLWWPHCCNRPQATRQNPRRQNSGRDHEYQVIALETKDTTMALLNLPFTG